MENGLLFPEPPSHLNGEEEEALELGVLAGGAGVIAVLVTGIADFATLDSGTSSVWMEDETIVPRLWLWASAAADGEGEGVALRYATRDPAEDAAEDRVTPSVG